MSTRSLNVATVKFIRSTGLHRVSYAGRAKTFVLTTALAIKVAVGYSASRPAGPFLPVALIAVTWAVFYSGATAGIYGIADFCGRYRDF